MLLVGRKGDLPIRKSSRSTLFSVDRLRTGLRGTVPEIVHHIPAAPTLVSRYAVEVQSIVPFDLWDIGKESILIERLQLSG